MSEIISIDEPGTKHLLLGNEAIARGVLEAGIGFVTCYPGTPSSEVPDTLAKISGQDLFYFEYSVNEKVALEVGGGAAIGGLPALVTMKHVGLNVAADPLMTLAYIGTPGGLIILSADDPGCHSSQNEQDNRYYCKLAGLPCFEPCSAQEAKDMIPAALKLSQTWEQPVLLRTTTRVNHLRGPVVFGPLPPKQKPGHFEKAAHRFVPLPVNARQRHPILLENLSNIKKEAEQSDWNKVWGQGKIGVVASGISRAYLHDALEDLGLADSFKVLELGLSYPLPEKIILEFLQGLNTVLVLEELEPVLEDSLRGLIQKNGLQVLVQGKGSTLSRVGEYSTSMIKNSLHQILGQEIPKPKMCTGEKNLPVRPPNLCPGCSHRAVYYAVRKVFGDQAVYSSDIGCYTLGYLPPLRAADFLFCMGSSVSGGTGLARATGQTVVAYIGDSTFFHSGITGLINAVHNNHDLLLIILDNQTTAMTGHQPHPGVEESSHGVNTTKVDIEQVVRGCGVENVRKIKPFQHKSTLQALEEFKGLNGVRVLIAEEPCVLFAQRTLGRQKKQTAYVAEQHPEVEACLKDLACPAFYVQEGNIEINENLCTGCMLCVQVCDQIKVKKRS